MNKLTAQIAAAYMPCKITDKYANGVHYDMVGISEYEGNLQVKMPSGDTDWWNIDICQLLLTPLSKILDEHAIEMAKIASGWDRAATLDPEDVVHWLEEIMNGNCALMADYVSGQQVQELIDYLRPHNYDVGHGSIPSLIAAGVAIEESK